MMRGIRFIGAVALLAIMLAGCSSEEEPPIGDARHGEELYTSGGESMIPCTTCHTLDGTTLVGPSFQGVGTRAAARVEGQSAEEYLRQSIINPSGYIVEGFSNTMPAIYAQTFSEE